MTNMSIAIQAIVTSVISCVRYLSIIQISNFYFNPLGIAFKSVKINEFKSYSISIITIFQVFSILKPIYLLSILAYVIA